MDAIPNKVDESLEESGISVIGRVNVESVSKHLFSPIMVHRGLRQTHLDWNPDCDKVLAEFENVGVKKRFSTPFSSSRVFWQSRWPQL